MKINEGDYVLDIKNNKKAYIEHIEDDSTCIIRYIDKNGKVLRDDKALSLKDIKLIKPYKINKETLIKYVELSINTDDFVPEDNIIDNYVFNDEIEDLCKHFYVSLKKLNKGIIYDDFRTWLSFISNYINTYTNVYSRDEITKVEPYSEADVLSYMLLLLEDIDFDYDGVSVKKLIPGSEFKETLNLIKYYIEDTNKPLSKKRFIDSFMFDHIRYYNEDTINDASDIEKEYFKEYVDRLCKKNNIKALKIKGYCMYCNSDVYPEDWKACRDIFEKIYKLTGDPYIANTLGYIYYYGRANNRIPEYNKAFKYFSIGAAKGIYESTYKLADCFKNGYGVVRNEEIAFSQYSNVYYDTTDDFINKKFDSKFADAALRMGGSFEKGIGVKEDLDTAYYYYLLAELAIELRMKSHNHYGDNKVSKGIKESLENIRKEYKNYKTSIKDRNDLPLFNQIFYARSLKFNADIKRNKNNSYSLTIKTYQSPYMEQKDMLISIPEFDYCGFKEEIKYETSKNSKLKVEGNKKSFMFNDYIYNKEDDSIIFLLDSKEIATLKTKYIEIKKTNIVKAKRTTHTL